MLNLIYGWQLDAADVDSASCLNSWLLLQYVPVYSHIVVDDRQAKETAAWNCIWFSFETFLCEFSSPAVNHKYQAK